MNALPDFQKILAKFEPDGTFRDLLWERSLSPDEFIYAIATDDGPRYVFETDYVGSVDWIERTVSEETGETVRFVPAQAPVAEFEQMKTLRWVRVYKKPEAWEAISRVVNDEHGSHPYYLTFLLRPD